jgi:hypothetical protein
MYPSPDPFTTMIRQMCTKDKIVQSLYQHTISWGDVPSDDDVLELDDWKSYQKIKTRAKEAYQHHVTSQKIYTIPQRSKAKKHCDKIVSRIPYAALKQRTALESIKKIVEKIVEETVHPPIEYQEIVSPPIEYQEIVSPPIGYQEIVSPPIGYQEIVPTPIEYQEIVSPPIEYQEIVPTPIEYQEIMQNKIVPQPIEYQEIVPNKMISTEMIAVHFEPIKTNLSLYVLCCILCLSLIIIFYRITYK